MEEPEGLEQAGEKKWRRLDGQIRQLEKVLAELTEMLEEERPMREQMMVMEAVGKASLRLAMLLRMQQQMEYMIFEVEDRIKRRKLQEERLFWSQNRSF